jgi:hypothetical protein
MGWRCPEGPTWCGRNHPARRTLAATAPQDGRPPPDTRLAPPGAAFRPDPRNVEIAFLSLPQAGCQCSPNPNPNRQIRYRHPPRHARCIFGHSPPTPLPWRTPHNGDSYNWRHENTCCLLPAKAGSSIALAFVSAMDEYALLVECVVSIVSISRVSPRARRRRACPIRARTKVQAVRPQALRN